MKQVIYLQQHTEIGMVGCKAQFFKEKIGDDDEVYRYCQNPKGEDFLMNLPLYMLLVCFGEGYLKR